MYLALLVLGILSYQPVIAKEKVVCSAAVTWEAPTERINGETLELSDLDKFTIYVSRRDSTEDKFLRFTNDITDVNLITWEFYGLKPGWYYFYMTVTDNLGYESPYSDILFKRCVKWDWVKLGGEAE